MTHSNIKERCLIINKLLVTDKKKALLQSQLLVKEQPKSSQVWLLLINTLYYCNALVEAEKSLNYLTNNFPYNATFYIELSSLLMKYKKYAKAKSLLAKAVSISPEYEQLWALLAECNYGHGNELEAKQALSQYNMIKSFNESLAQAEKIFTQKDYVAADKLCRQLLIKVPNELRTLRLMAKIANKFDQTKVAVSILEYCRQASPDNLQISTELVDALLANKQHSKALSLCHELLEIEPNNITLLPMRAAAEVSLGYYIAALNTYKMLISIHPQKALCLLRQGNVLKTVGKTDEAILSFKHALEYEPMLGEAYWNLANLKTYLFSKDEINQMEKQLDNDQISSTNQILIQFALGKAYEDEHNYSMSFEHYHKANDMKYRPLTTDYKAQRNKLAQIFTEDYFIKNKLRGNGTKSPLFIVGLPRSGSTLVEQILASHSQVDGTMELTEVITIARQLNKIDQQQTVEYPESLLQLTDDEIKLLAQQYLDHVAPMRQKGNYFIDKLPNNFIHIGLIKTMFPQAKIIDVRRNPMANGWSVYKQFFAGGNEFSYDLASIAQYYNHYIEMMTHWAQVLPDQILTIQYEDLVNNFEAMVQKMIRYCGLQLESSCLTFYENNRAVATASAEQVRKPIYTNALHQWKNYENFLLPLKDNLHCK